MPNGQQTPTALGVTENLGGALAYLLGPITGILFLLIEKNNQFVRFHAMQSTILWVAMFILSSVLGIIPILGWLVLLLLIPFQISLSRATSSPSSKDSSPPSRDRNPTTRARTV